MYLSHIKATYLWKVIYSNNLYNFTFGIIGPFHNSLISVSSDKCVLHGMPRWPYLTGRHPTSALVDWIPVCWQHTLQWRHNGRTVVLNHRRPECLLNRLFSRRSEKTSKLRATGLCEGNSSVTGEFPSQRASNAENVSIWRHHGYQSVEAIKIVRDTPMDSVSTHLN